jgi:hypothetical protein
MGLDTISSSTSPPSSGKNSTSLPVARSESLFRRFANRIWGFDFFVSYQWASGGPYALNLAEALRALHYECFLDRSEFAVGDDWRREAEKALRNSHRLVVIATREAIAHSRAVQHEVEIFISRSHRVIPIVFDKRFSDDERGQFPILQLIPDVTVDIVEESSRLDKGPSEHVLTQLIQAHRLLRRRAVRALVVATAFSILTIAAVVACVFWGLAVREKLLAQSEQLINQSDMLRETQGPKLDESLELASTAYKKSRLAGRPSAEASRAIQQALQLMPERIGAPWSPFGPQVSVDLQALDQRLILMPNGQTEKGEDFAIVAEWNSGAREWRIVQRFTNNVHLELKDAYGQRIRASANPRWLVTGEHGHIVIWDLANGLKHAEILFEHKPNDSDGTEFLCLNAGGDYLLARKGRQLDLWTVKNSSESPRTLPIEASYARYALSASGELLACARQNEFILVRIKDGQKLLEYPITQSGGHPESLVFVEGTSFQKDLAIAVSWSASQVAQMSPAARRNAPNHQAGIWQLGAFTSIGSDNSILIKSPPDLIQVRRNTFDLAFSADRDFSLAIVDPDNPVQWLDVESQLSFTLGSSAGPGTKARFGPDGGRLLIVHIDGTARLWDLHSRIELLRFTAPHGIVDAAFLVRSSTQDSRSVPLVVTVERNGGIQAWTGQGRSARPEDFTTN